MKTPQGIHVFIFMGILFAALVPSATLAAPNSEQIADATVNIYCQVKIGNKTYGSSGSGVFIDARGVILTNAHVVQYYLLPPSTAKTQCSVRTGSPAKSTYTAELMYFPPQWLEENADELGQARPQGSGENDFALLYVTKTVQGDTVTTFPALSIGDLALRSTKDEVTIAGYPSDELDFDAINTRLKQEQGETSIKTAQYFVHEDHADALTLMNAPIGGAGTSGGPVVDEDGNLIGIVTGISTAKEDPTLRAITIDYIDRTIQARSDSTLASLLNGNYLLRAILTYIEIPSESRETIERSLRKKR